MEPKYVGRTSLANVVVDSWNVKKSTNVGCKRAFLRLYNDYGPRQLLKYLTQDGEVEKNIDDISLYSIHEAIRIKNDKPTNTNLLPIFDNVHNCNPNLDGDLKPVTAKYRKIMKDLE